MKKELITILTTSINVNGLVPTILNLATAISNLPNDISDRFIELMTGVGKVLTIEDFDNSDVMAAVNKTSNVKSYSFGKINQLEESIEVSIEYVKYKYYNEDKSDFRWSQSNEFSNPTFDCIKTMVKRFLTNGIEVY